MNKAITNKDSQTLITVEEFYRLYSREYEQGLIYPVCPNCGRKLILYGIHSLEVKARFNHPEHSENCELSDTKKAAQIPDYDFQNRKILDELKNQENRKKIYAVCKDIINNKFKFSEFYELEKIAKNRNIYYYKNLEIWMIPYILLTLKNFDIMKKNGDGLYTVQFVLKNSLRATIGNKHLKFELNKIFSDSKKPAPPYSYSISKEQFEDIDISWIKYDLKEFDFA